MPTPAHPTTVRHARRRPLPPRLQPWQRARRVVLIALWLCLIPVSISYLTTISRPSNSNFMINSFEWLRDHGAAPIASQIENFYYSLNAPSTGGAALRKLPLRSHAVAQFHPPDVAPVLHPALSGEGVWAPSETWSGASPPVQITQFRSDPNFPQMVAGVAWIDTARTRIGYYPGRLEPSVSLPARGAMEVPSQSRSRLTATFNSAFKLSDSGGGFALDGHTYAPLKDGLATLIGYSNGRVDVVAWSGGPQARSGAAFARQTLPLIVNGGQPNPNLSDGPEWG